MIFGTFDTLHPGHEFVLKEAGTRGVVTVIVARNVNVQRMKGHTPKQNESKRMAAIRKAYPGYDVQLGDSNDFLAPVRKTKPDLILLGYDQNLPPGITADLLGYPVDRLPAYLPEKYKSSILR